MVVPPAHWVVEQVALKEKLQLGKFEHEPKYIVGLDISMYKGTQNGVCTGVVLSLPDLTLIDQESQVITIIEPYIAGYLAFREVAHYISVYKELEKRHPDKCKDIIMTDGNGILHPHGFGLACHLGVLLDVPTVGCGKALHEYWELEYNQKDLRETMDKENLQEMEIKEKNGHVCGWAIRGSNLNPIYVSPGYKTDTDVCLQIAKTVMKTREPEPTRLADRISREFIRLNPL